MERWLFGIDAWIIQDGNYPDFRVGQHAEFAIEFGSVELAVVRDAEPHAELRPVRWRSQAETVSSNRVSGAAVVDGLPTYDLVAEIVRREPWVVDFGLRAYCDGLETPLGEVGTVVSFSAYLGVDPFTYFEQLAKDKTVPPLIYTWRVERIGRETAPWIEQEPRFFVRDHAKHGFAEVRETNAWEDDAGSAAYVLECTLIDPEPRRRSSTAVYP